MVSGTECLDYTSVYLQNESISRTRGDVNYKEYSMSAKKPKDIMRLAKSLVETHNLTKIRPSTVRRQYVIMRDNEKLSDDRAVEIINCSNYNRFKSWDERERYQKNVRIISPVSDDRKANSHSGYRCTCQTYMDEYECEHAMAISIAKNELSQSIIMHMPLGLKRGPGRPVKAVKGALNPQIKVNKKNSKIELSDTTITQGNALQLSLIRLPKLTRINLPHILLGNGDAIAIDSEKRLILKGFVWDNMSCSYDALFTTLWMIYFLGREEIRNTFNSTLPLMAKMYREMIGNTLTFKEANDRIRDTYFISTPIVDFRRGVFQGVSDITSHLLLQCVLSVDENEKDCFTFQYNCIKKCTNTLCIDISKERTSECALRCLFFGVDVDTTKTVTQMIIQYFALENRNFRCHVCSHQMVYTKSLVSCPLILCICFNGTSVLSEFEKVVVIKNETYDFVSALYLLGQHFRTRFNISNKAYEYDGILNGGVLKEINSKNAFCGTIFNVDKTVMMVAMSIYYVKRDGNELYV